MEAPRKIIVDDFMSDEEDSHSSSSNIMIRSESKRLNREEFEESKSKFSLKKMIADFIIKKEYFISHKTTDINNDFKIAEKPIGSGAFGVVYKGYSKQGGGIKAIKKLMLKDIQDRKSFYDEVNALKTLDHPNIIKLYDVYEDEEEG